MAESFLDMFNRSLANAGQQVSSAFESNNRRELERKRLEQEAEKMKLKDPTKKSKFADFFGVLESTKKPESIDDETWAKATNIARAKTQATGKPVDQFDVIEEMTKSDQVGKMRDLWRGGIPKKEDALQVLGQYEPIETTKELYAVGVSPLAQARFEAQQEKSQKLKDADEFYINSVLPKYEKMIADGDISQDEAKEFAGLFSQYEAKGGKTKNPLQTYWSGLKETSMAQKREIDIEKAQQNIKADKLKYEIDLKLWEQDQEKLIPESKKKDWKDLTEQYRKNIANYKEGAEGAKKTLSLMDQIDPTSASDLATIFTFMKALDPRSVVRESEFEAAASVGGFFDKAFNSIKKAQGEGLLGTTARKDIRDAVLLLHDEYTGQAKIIDDYYSRLARGQGLPPETIILPSSLYTYREDKNNENDQKKKNNMNSVVDNLVGSYKED